MALKAVPLLLLLAIVGSVHSQSHCSSYGGGTNEGRDCSCADRSFRECLEPSTEDELHVADLAECKSECDELATVGGCNWFIFDQTGGQDINCKLYGPGKESMVGYLSSCNVIGGALRNEADTCLADLPPPFCQNTFYCPGGCRSCAGDTACNDFAETECTIGVAESSTTNAAPNLIACQSVMTVQGASEVINYFTFDQRAELCKGFPSGNRFCNKMVASQTMDLADIQSCQT